MVFIFYPTPFRDERGTMSHVFQGCGSKKGRRKCFNVNSQHILLPLTISPFCAWLFPPCQNMKRMAFTFSDLFPPRNLSLFSPFHVLSRVFEARWFWISRQRRIAQHLPVRGAREEDPVNLGLFSSLPFFGHEFFGHVVVFIVWPPEFFSRDVLSSLFRCQFIKFFSVPLLGPKSSFELLICFERSAVRIFSGAGLSWLFLCPTQEFCARHLAKVVVFPKFGFPLNSVYGWVKRKYRGLFKKRRKKSKAKNPASNYEPKSIFLPFFSSPRTEQGLIAGSILSGLLIFNSGEFWAPSRSPISGAWIISRMFLWDQNIHNSFVALHLQKLNYLAILKEQGKFAIKHVKKGRSLKIIWRLKWDSEMESC